MRLLARLALSVVGMTAASACSGGAPADESVLQRIQRVENGMLPAVLVRGQEPPRTTIRDVMERYHVPGVSIAVINDGRLEWAKGYGVREVGGAAVDTATLFLAGHIGQAVAAMVALALVEEGQLGLDQSVNDRLTSWRVPDNELTTTEKVSLRRILSHTSGLSVPSLVGYSTSETLPSTIQILDGMTPATNDPIRVLDTPGSRQRHSLGGYVVLQQLVEDLTGLPYAALAREKVLSRLGMTRSFHTQPLTEALAANAASGYEPTNERVPGRWRVYPELAALGMWTTPSDLARLAVELQESPPRESNGVLSRAAVQEMLSRQTQDRGLGFEVGGEGEWRWFRLEGHGNNYLSELYAYGSRGMGAVVMTNSSHGEGVKAAILRAIAAEYAWPDFVPERVEVAHLPDEALQELAGRYALRRWDRVLAVDQGRILQRSEGDLEEELLPLSEDELVSVSFGYRYAIERDAVGSVTGLTLVWQGTRLFTYERVGAERRSTADPQHPTGPYLGQSPPGRRPQVFLPGIVSTGRDDAGVVVFPGGNEVYFWAVENRGGSVTSTIYVTTQRQGSWSSPEVAPFSGVHTDGYIALHPDGSRLYFQSNRPIDSAESTFEWNLWYVERQGSGWSEPRSMGRPINGRNHTGGPSVTRDGTLYFTVMELGGRQDLYRSRYVNGAYQEPERLPDAVNAHVQQCDSYVAPDESYLVFYAVEGSGGHGSPAGLYVAFRDRAGTWSDARKMGPAVNGGERMGPATISPDGRFLFFGRDDPDTATGMDVYWVAAALLDELK